jgi:ubiquinone biosynthesis protein
MPRLVREFLVQQVNGAHTINMRSAELAELARISRDGQRQTTWAILGAGLLVSAVVLHALDAAGPAIFGLSGAVWLACAGALGCFLAAWPRRT